MLDTELDKIQSHIWHIQGCSALKGEGMITGIKWLSEQLVFRGKNNFPNNPYLINDETNTGNDSDNTNKKDKDISISVNNPQDTVSSEMNIKNDVGNDNDNMISINNTNNIENNNIDNNNNDINTSSNNNN